jgi:NAD-dependent DNA ligase
MLIFEDWEEEKVIEALKDWDDAYFNTDDAKVSDMTYDEHYLAAKKSWPDNDYFQKVGATVRGSKIKHA